jgi:hypothetical protein
MIVWLDQNITSSDCCKQLKKAFATTTNPESKLLTNIDELDVSNLIRDDSTYGETTFLQVPFIFRLFSHIEPCLRFLLRNSINTRIFFITSGSLGEHIVPRILTDHQEIFKDKNGKLYEDSIYIFCADTKKHSEWAYDYLDLNCIKIENDDKLILARLTRDIAQYFVSQGEQLFQNNNISSFNDAKQYYTWARQLYLQADSVKKMPSTSDLISNIDQSINEIEKRVKELPKNNNDDDNEINMSEEN